MPRILAYLDSDSNRHRPPAFFSCQMVALVSEVANVYGLNSRNSEIGFVRNHQSSVRLCQMQSRRIFQLIHHVDGSFSDSE